MPDDVVRLPVAISRFDELNVEQANWFAFQEVGPDEFHLTVGQAHVPLFAGNTKEERRQSAEAAGYVTVRAVAKIGLTANRARELIGLLQRTLEGPPEPERLG